MTRLRRFLAHLFLGLCLGTAHLCADGADDAFIRIYNLIQQAEAHRETGRLGRGSKCFAGIIRLGMNGWWPIGFATSASAWRP
jgi:hypothetical protein